MKHARFVIAGISLFLFLGVCGPAHAEDSEIEIQVDGLSCPFCVVGLKGSLEKIEALKDIEVNYKKGLVKARWDETKPFDEESIKKAVRDAGFTPKHVSFSPHGEKR